MMITDAVRSRPSRAARVWAVFPFAFDGPEWTLVARAVLVVAMVGTAIAVLVQAVSMTGRTIRSGFRPVLSFPIL